MDKFLREQIYKWSLDKIEENPEKFAGDDSNPNIMHEYLMEHYGDKKVSELHPFVFSILSTTSRQKNKVLENNPELDKRERYHPSKYKKKKDK